MVSRCRYCCTDQHMLYLYGDSFDRTSETYHLLQSPRVTQHGNFCSRVDNRYTRRRNGTSTVTQQLQLQENLQLAT
jgi:hypothetical protein